MGGEGETYQRGQLIAGADRQSFDRSLALHRHNNTLKPESRIQNQLRIAASGESAKNGRYWTGENAAQVS